MSNKVFVGGLAWSATEEEFADHFSTVGSVVESRIIKDRETGRSRGFGFITFATAEEAQKAIEELNGSEFMGREIRVSLAEEKPASAARSRRPESSSRSKITNFRPNNYNNDQDYYEKAA